MTNEAAIKALKEIKAYCSTGQLEGLDYVIAIVEKLEKEGVKEPLATDFTKLSEK